MFKQISKDDGARIKRIKVQMIKSRNKVKKKKEKENKQTPWHKILVRTWKQQMYKEKCREIGDSSIFLLFDLLTTQFAFLLAYYWLLSCCSSLNFCPQCSHSYVAAEFNLRWSLRVLRWGNLCGHWSHLYGLAPVCLASWDDKLVFSANLISQISYSNGLICSCTAMMCVFKWIFCLKVSP